MACEHNGSAHNKGVVKSAGHSERDLHVMCTMFQRQHPEYNIRELDTVLNFP